MPGATWWRSRRGARSSPRYCRTAGRGLRPCRANGAEDVGRGGALVRRCRGPRATLGPAPRDLVLLADACLVGEPHLYTLRCDALLLRDRVPAGWEAYGIARPFGKLLYCGWRFEGAGESRCELQFSELILARTAAALWGKMVRAKASNGVACGRRTSLGSLKAFRLASSQWRPAAVPIILAVF